MAVCPSDGNGTIDWRSGIGAGGYQLKRFEPGVSAQMERNPNFWNPDRAHADNVELLAIIDPTAQVNALLTGEVDAIDGVDPKVVDLMSRKEGIFVDEVAGSKHYTFPMRTDTPPFTDVHVRLAIKHAVDREEMLSKILGGHGTIGNDTPIGPTFRYRAVDLEPFPYDPDKARWHLKQAGMDSLAVELSAADAAFAGAVDASVLYQERARKAGIDIKVVREPNDGYWSNIWMQKPWSACYWGSWPTEDEMFTLAYSSGASWNDTYWENERFNELLVLARSETGIDKRRQMYVEMQHILRDQGGVVAPMFANFLMGRSERVTHGELGSDRGFDGYRMIERWWVA
jgi:peptide/nickel transport system substrate-binding protein